MLQYIITFGFFLFVFILMGLALQFSRYKQRHSGCCGGGHCSTEVSGDTNSQNCCGDKLDPSAKNLENDPTRSVPRLSPVK